MGVGWAYGWSCTLECFFNFFGSFNASTAYHEKRGFSLSASKNVFWWWVCSFGSVWPGGVKFPPFYTQDHFQWLLFCMAVNRKHPFMVNDSSVNVAYWIGNAGMGKPNIGLDFTYYLCITWHRACAMQILSINMEILGPLSIYGTA